MKNRYKKKVRFEENKTKESSRLVLRSGRVSKRTKKARGAKKKLRKFI